MDFENIPTFGQINRKDPEQVWDGSAWVPHGLGKFDQRFEKNWPTLHVVGGKWLPNLHLFISTPVYDGSAHNTYMRSIIELAMQFRTLGIAVQFSWPRGDGIARCRNRQITEFLASPATHFVSIDADIGFQPQHLLNMITSYQDVVFGAYPAKGIEWNQVIDGVKNGTVTTPEDAVKNSVRFVVNFQEEDIRAGRFQGVQFADGRSFIKLKEGSTGFMVIRREVIEKLIAAYPERAYQDDYPGPTHGKRMYDLFHMGMDPSAPNEQAITKLKKTALEMTKGADINALVGAAWDYARTYQDVIEKTEALPRYLSEDYGFCRLWSGIGGDVHVYTGAELSHTGQYVYQGAFDQVFRPSRDVADNAPATETQASLPFKPEAQPEVAA